MANRLAALVAVVIIALLPTATVQAQTTDPPYLSQMPAVDRVMAEIKGPDPMDTAARQMGAFWQLQKMVEDLAGDRRWRNHLTPDEGTLIGQYRYGYELASKPYEHIGNAPSHPDKPAWFKLYNFYLYDDGLLDELLQHFFTPQFRTAYYQASGKQPPPQGVAAPAPPGALVASARAQEDLQSFAPRDTLAVHWSFKANEYQLAKPGSVVAMICPSVLWEELGHRYVWGTDVYTDDSTVCFAAVHAGLIEPDYSFEVFDRTVVVVEYLGGQMWFTGSERNGVMTADYGPWTASFRFVVP